MSPSGELYFDAEGSRYFVLPAGQVCAPGELELMSLDGRVMRVDAGAAEVFRVEEAVADSFSAAHATRVLEVDASRVVSTAAHALNERLAPIRAAAPGLDSLLKPPAAGQSSQDPAAVLGQLLGLDLTGLPHQDDADAAPHPATAGLDALVDALAQAVGHPKGALGGPSESMDDVLAKVTALSENLKGLPAGSQPGAAEAGPWSRFLAAVQTFMNASAPPDPQEGYRQAARDSVDRAFKDFKLPSFRYEDLVKPPPPKEAHRADEEP